MMQIFIENKIKRGVIFHELYLLLGSLIPFSKILMSFVSPWPQPSVCAKWCKENGEVDLKTRFKMSID